MSAPFKPHTVTVQSASTAFDANVAAGRELGAASTVKCQVTPMSADLAYASFNVEVKEAWQLIADATDEIAAGSKVVWKGQTFWCRGVKTFEVGSSCDHTLALLTKERTS